MKEHANAGAVTDEIHIGCFGNHPAVSSRIIPEQIKVQNFYLNQKMLFFYGIALVLLVISPSAYYEQYTVSGGDQKHDSGF